MEAKALLDAGKLTAAIDSLGHELRSAPTDEVRRVFLFELLCFAGEFERAEQQLQALRAGDAVTDLGVDALAGTLKAEGARQSFYREGTQPTFLFDPPGGTALRLEAAECLRAQRFADARKLLDQSDEEFGPVEGHSGDKAFPSFRDSDELLGPFLEILAGDRYAWIPFSELRRLEVKAPAKLRDLVWLEASLESRDGKIGNVFIPVLYAQSWRDEDDAVKLGRLTKWDSLGGKDGVSFSLGQRIFDAGDVELPLLKIGEVHFTG